MWLASVSATGIWVPSTATTSRPANLSMDSFLVMAGPERRSKRLRNGAGPTRRMAWEIDEAAGGIKGCGSEAVNRL
ncbi:hypothetical protein CFAEC_05235 [Corynebacterium faecale]|nr:hypothetical protein CFAEC_05235 [Corynebacterium faecale]